MNRFRLLGATLIAGLCFASQLRAAEHASFATIRPEQAVAVLSVERLATVDRRLSAFLHAAGQEDAPSLCSIITALGFEQGIDFEGSAAIALTRPDPERSIPATLVALLPVTSHESFIKGVRGEEQDERWAFVISGERYLAQHAGERHIAIAQSDEAFAILNTTPPGETTPASKLLESVASRADVVVRGEARGLADAWPSVLNALASATESLEARAADEPDEPDEPDHPAALEASLLGRLARTVRDESRGLIAGLAFEPDHVRFEIASEFVADGVLAQAASRPGPGGANTMTLLPDEPFVAAIGLDAGHPCIRLILDEFTPPDRALGILAGIERTLMRPLAEADVAALCVYNPSSILFGGLARSLLVWRAPESDAPIISFREWIQRLDRFPAGLPDASAVYSAQYNEGARKEQGLAIDAWNITFPPGSAPMLPMLLGNNLVMEGRAAASSDRGGLALAPVQPLLAAALAPAKPGTRVLADAAPVVRAAGMLPGSRLLEAYIDLSPIIQQFGAMMTMMNGGERPPSSIPLVALALTAGDAGATMTIAVPAEALDAAVLLLSRGSPPRGEQAPPERPKSLERRSNP